MILLTWSTYVANLHNQEFVIPGAGDAWAWAQESSGVMKLFWNQVVMMFIKFHNYTEKHFGVYY